MGAVKDIALQVQESLAMGDYAKALELLTPWKKEAPKALWEAVESLTEDLPGGRQLHLAVFTMRNYELTAPAFSREGALAILSGDYRRLRESAPELELGTFAQALEDGAVYVVELELNKTTWL